MNFIFQILLFGLLVSCYGKLAMVQEISRHGIRASLASELGKIFDVSKGELTGSGMRQLYLSGKQAREKYLAALELDESFNETQVYVRSTDHNRTIDSAQSHFLGMFEKKATQLNEKQIAMAKPPLELTISDSLITSLKEHPLPYDFTVFPIQVFEPFNDTFDEHFCKKSQKTNRDIWENSAEVADILTQKDAVVKQIYGALNITEEVSRTKLFYYMDLLICMYFEGLELPISNDTFTELMDLQKLLFPHRWASDMEANKLRTTGIVGNLLEKFENHINASATDKPDPLKYAYYSTHDDTLAVIFAALGVEYDGWVPFASKITVELYTESEEEDNMSYFFSNSADPEDPQPNLDNFKVKIFFNYQPIAIGDCDKECKWTEFRDALKAVQIEGNILDQCKLDNPVSNLRSQLQIKLLK